jgi:hypothetical protein
MIKIQQTWHVMADSSKMWYNDKIRQLKPNLWRRAFTDTGIVKFKALKSYKNTLLEKEHVILQKFKQNSLQILFQENQLWESQTGFPSYYDVDAGKGHVDSTKPNSIGYLRLHTILTWTHYMIVILLSRFQQNVLGERGGWKGHTHA